MRAVLFLIALIPGTMLAHGAEDVPGTTDLAEADWQSPLLALIVILIAAAIARSLRRRTLTKPSPPLS